MRSLFVRSANIFLTLAAVAACSPATTDIAGTTPPPRPDSTPPAITSVVAAAHTCALSTSGTAYCWGFITEGQSGSDETVASPTPILAAPAVVFQSISVSKVEDASCARSTEGAAYCWGENEHGQLGDGTTVSHSTPMPVSGGLTFKSIAVGDAHVCGVTMSGAMYCWGFSANGAFGDGTVGQRLTPGASAPDITFQSVVAGGDYTCGLTIGGAAVCWGNGLFGQLGDGTAKSSTTPVAVTGGLTFRSLTGGGLGVCGLTDVGKAYCWGNDFYGTIGDGSSATEDGIVRRAAPVAVAGDLTFASLSAGYQTMCGVTTSGAGYCWGYNAGAIGDGTLDHHSKPVAVAGGLTFRSISSGTGYGCGIVTTNAVYCWGDNSGGGLGDGTFVSHTVPAPVRWP